MILFKNRSRGLITASLGDLEWMVGPWRGALGSQTVAESWSEPFAGSMSTMVRLSSESSIDMIELIEIREINQKLSLHLRQFTSGLEAHYSGDFELAVCDHQGVRFESPGNRIESLSYLKADGGGMRVEVGIVGGVVVGADLNRP